MHPCLLTIEEIEYTYEYGDEDYAAQTQEDNDGNWDASHDEEWRTAHAIS